MVRTRRDWAALMLASFIAGFGYGAGREVFQYFRTERIYRAYQKRGNRGNVVKPPT